eukprot:TRINITY_DN1999_c2_g1_i2.p1 TRINITY_DN1999_c2_g1~~TRINITY_DN1999_c2_g1_i2.p1  ORF type:complete len:594 (-),score=108.50 TRINITY_DN1999_c2_g1_i2:12-1592(-)
MRRDNDGSDTAWSKDALRHSRQSLHFYASDEDEADALEDLAYYTQRPISKGHDRHQTLINHEIIHPHIQHQHQQHNQQQHKQSLSICPLLEGSGSVKFPSQILDSHPQNAVIHEGLLSPVLLHTLLQIAQPWKIQDLLCDAFALCSSQGQAYELYCELLEKELLLFSADSDSKSALLYPTSTTCKLMYAFHRYLSFHFLPSLLLDIVKYIMNQPLCYQLSTSNRLETRDDIQVSNLTSAITDILQRLFRANIGLPLACQAACIATQDRFKAKFDEETGQEVAIVFTVNSLLIPALLQPHVHGLSLEAPNEQQSQALACMANTILQISKGEYFATQPWMQMNDFIMQQHRFVRACMSSSPHLDQKEIDKCLRQPLPFKSRLGSHISSLCIEIQENCSKIIKLTPHLIFLIEILHAHNQLQLSPDCIYKLRKVCSGPPDVSDLFVLQSIIHSMKVSPSCICPKSHPGKQLILFARSHQKCFLGSEVVDWLMVNICHFASLENSRRRTAAIELGYLFALLISPADCEDK